jgi:hypothetical protein
MLSKEKRQSFIMDTWKYSLCFGHPIMDEAIFKRGCIKMGGKRKKPGNVGLSSPQVEGQGTTGAEFDGKSMSSSRKSNKKN